MMTVYTGTYAEPAFLCSARNEEEARKDMQTSIRCNSHIEVRGLYEVICILDEFDDPEVPKLQIDKPLERPALYLHNGIVGKKKGSITSFFFASVNHEQALRETRERGWFQSRLYQCIGISLT